MLRQGGYYYLFYSGNACCGRGCNYALGVARAQDMLGPWEKAPSNPILAGNAAWRCPGHGSIVTDLDGRHWLLYHAYAQKGFVATGREMLLDEVVFGSDGWPTINGGKGPSTGTAGPRTATRQTDITQVRDDFSGAGLTPAWQWPIGRKPTARMTGGFLTLEVGDGPATAVQSITVPSFVAETAVDPKALSPGASAGLVVYGDRANHIALVTDGQKIQLWSEQKGQRNKVAEANAQPGAAIRLRIACIDGNRFRFALQGAGGKWMEVAGETDGSFLPPWDRGVRTGVSVIGNPGASASFDYFTAKPGDEALFSP